MKEQQHSIINCWKAIYNIFIYLTGHTVSILDLSVYLSATLRLDKDTELKIGVVEMRKLLWKG